MCRDFGISQFDVTCYYFTAEIYKLIIYGICIWLLLESNVSDHKSWRTRFSYHHLLSSFGFASTYKYNEILHKTFTSKCLDVSFSFSLLYFFDSVVNARNYSLLCAFSQLKGQLLRQLESRLFSLLPGRCESFVMVCDVFVGDWFNGSAGIKPSLMRFFCFIRRFWNHILT